MARPEVGMFSHNDGIVDHDAEGDDQCEQRDHVEGKPKRIHHRDRRQHCDRDTHRHPKGGPGIEEQEQQGQHQRETETAVVQKDFEPVGDELGAGADQLDLHTLRQRQHHLGGDILNNALHPHRVTLGRPADIDGHRARLADIVGDVAVDALDVDIGHVTDGQLGPIRVRPEDDAEDVVFRAFRDTGADPRGSGGDVARRVGRRLFGNGAGDLAHRDVVQNERSRGGLDNCLRCRNAADRCARHAISEQPRHHLVGKPRELVDADGA